MILKAAAFADTKHAGQLRKYTNYPYITHVARVAGRTGIIPGVTVEAIAAAYLHDTVEDCGVSLGEIALEFNEEVSDIVFGLTNPSKQRRDLNRAERKALDREFIRLQPRIVRQIKLLDRIDNISELPFNDEFTPVYCRETLALAEALAGTDISLERELYARVAQLSLEHLRFTVGA